MAPECVQVKIDIGHKSVCRTDKTEEGYTHDWVVFVRGTDGSNISHFVEKVVFHLHESFPKPKRVIKLPPYKVEESGYGSFLLNIEIYFRNKEEPKKVKFDYDLYLQLVGNPPVTNVRVEVLTFTDPVEDFKKKLLKGGGVIVSGMNPTSANPPGLPSLPAVSKPDGPGQFSPASPSASSQSPQAASKTKSSPPSTTQQTTSHTSKPPKLKDKDPSLQTTNVVGGKRTNAEEVLGSQKVKKKKVDKPSDGGSKTVPKEVPILGQSDDKGKTKNSATSAKKGDEIKERRKPGDVANEKLKSTKSGKDGKKEIVKDTKGKDLKDKGKKDKVKKDDKNSDEPKVQKLTVKRTSTDAWSSSAKNAGNKDKEFDALLSEFGAEDSENELDELDDPVGNMRSKGVNQDSNANESIKPASGKGKKSGKTKSPPTATPNSEHLKMNGTKKKDGTSPQNGKSGSESNPLVELWRRISTTEDRDTLQRIVDIVESTGKFEVTDSTFDFDLCCLDSDTIDKLRDSVAAR